MNCENCNKEHEGFYASGRFCCKKCAHSFSTKKNRKEINSRISKSLLTWYSENYIPKPGKVKEPSEKIVKIIPYKKCDLCDNTYQNNKKYCSKICQDTGMSINMANKIIKGYTTGIKSIYKFKDEEIKCDSKVEYTCLNYFETNFNITSIKRCDFYIEYLDTVGKTRRFVPDFFIITEDEIFIVECKTILKDKHLNEKWRNYNEISKIKKEVLEKFCIENNYKSFWFTKELHCKYYDKLRL